MSTTKKTIIPEKVKIINDVQLAKLREISNEIYEVKNVLKELKGEDDISSIMFDVGQCVSVIDRCEDALDEIVDSYVEQDDSWK